MRILKVNLNHHRERILDQLGEPPDLTKLDDAQFWTDEQQEIIKILRPEIERMALEGAETAVRLLPVGVDWGLVAEDAAVWAGGYTYDLVRGINDTTRRTLQRKVMQWIDTPGLTIGDLRRELRPVFGDVRAQMIAVTETTRAFAQGERAVAERARAQGLELTAIWNTAGDDKVCPICGPNDRLPEDEWQGVEWPPAHPRCRCWVTHRWERAARTTPSRLSGAEWAASLSDDEEFVIEQYTSTEYLPWNRGLWGQQELAPEDEENIATLDAAIKRSVLAEDQTLWRGSGSTWLPPFENLPGTILTDPAYMSTSKGEGVGRRFAGFAAENAREEGTRDVPVLWQIRAPQGTTAADLSQGLASLGEQEVLLPRGTKLRILSVQDDTLDFVEWGEEYANMPIKRVVAEII